jgi:hypothetical protein
MFDLVEAQYRFDYSLNWKSQEALKSFIVFEARMGSNSRNYKKVSLAM